MRLKAHQYQLDAARFLLGSPFSALYADPGTGKTAIMLMLIKALKKRGELPPCLITAPLRIATSTWPEEIAHWEQFHGITYEVLHGTKKAEAAKRRADIHLVNNEGLAWLAESGYLKRYRMLVIDESSKFKNWSSGRTKLLRSVLRQFHRRHCLTGSPAPRSLLDLFAQQYLADGGRTLGQYITRYRSKYFVDKGYQYPDWHIREGAEDEIYRAIAPSCYRLDRMKVLNMPELIVNDIKLSVSDKVRALTKQALAETSSTSLAAQLVRRIAGGISEAGELYHSAKIDALENLRDELQGQNMIVFFFYRSEGDFLSRKFKAPVVHGGTSLSAGERALAQWKEGKLPLLFLQPGATGHGLNLQSGGHHVVYFSYTHNQDDYKQSIDRVYRQGQKETTFLHRLICEDTIDEPMIKSLEKKTSNQQALLDAVGELRARYSA